MLKISWYWVAAGVALVVVVAGSKATLDVSPSTAQLSDTSGQSVQESVAVAVPDEPSSQSTASNTTETVTVSTEVSRSHRSSSQHEVLRVIDGDTIEVLYEGKKRSVRYIGVDTPETVHPSKPTGCFGAEAAAYNHSLVAGLMVTLERDISDVDKYGRLLRYVYVDEKMVNLALVEGGYAQVVTYPPDVRHIDIFRRAETVAREAGRGLWGSVCAGEYEPRLEMMDGSGQQPIDATCVIKGNISQTTGERIYHYPGCEYYEPTRINETTGERWFCSEQEAVAAGWRKALNCG